MRADDPRAELARLWDEHLASSFPPEWDELEERFGSPVERPELQKVAGADQLLEAWGSPDLHLYDTSVAGHISTILMGRRAGADVLRGSPPDARLERYLQLCSADATHEDMRRKIDRCRSYFDSLNEMLQVGRLVQAR